MTFPFVLIRTGLRIAAGDLEQRPLQLPLPQLRGSDFFQVCDRETHCSEERGS